MQRAVPATTPSQTDLGDRTLDEPPKKRLKSSNGDAPRPSPPITLQSQQLQSVQDEESARRATIADRLAEKAGDSKWVLSTVNGDQCPREYGLRVVTAGYSDLDLEDRASRVVGRMRFGKFNPGDEVAEQELSFPCRVAVFHFTTSLIANVFLHRLAEQ